LSIILILFPLIAYGCFSDDSSWDGFAPETGGIDYWVAADGNDQAKGGVDSPFKTLQRARDAVRANGQRGGKTITVNIKGGVYRLDATLTLDARDSGGLAAEVVYRAATGEDVVISGGQPVTGWTLHDPRLDIWSAPVDMAVRPRQLYVNDQRATRARTPQYPNYYTPTDTGYVYQYIFGTDPQIPPNWDPRAAVEAVTVTQWKMMRCPVDEVRNGNDVIMKNPCWQNANVFPYPWNFHLLSWWENAYVFLDQPGEWYLDPDGKTLYYIPRPGEDLSTARVEIPVLEKLVDVQGQASSPVRHIRFQDLAFAHATWLGPNGNDGYALDQSGFHLTGTGHKANKIGHDPKTEGIPGNVHLMYAQNITFENNTFEHMGGIALHFGTGSQNNAIVDNRFRDISAAAIQLGGIAVEDHHPQNPAQLTRDNRISDNLIEYAGQEYYDAPGIYIGFSTRGLIEHNEIRHVPWSGIAMGWGWGLLDPGGFAGLPHATPKQWGDYDTPSAARGNRVVHNLIEHYLEELWDGGAFYCNGFQGTSMEDGLLLAWNVARYKRPKAGSNTYYTDGGSRFVTVKENVSLNNPEGFVDFGPCGKSSSFDISKDKLCLLTNILPYGADMGGCVPYGDMLFESNYLRDSITFYDICENKSFPDAPYNMNFIKNVKVLSAAEVPDWILESAGRRR
jgi:hypothetical protein